MRQLPPSLTRVGKRIDRLLPWTLYYAGGAVECPPCGGRFRRFRSHAGRPNARCPRCRSLERHRLLWLYLTEQTELFSQPLNLLHFAPEPAFEARFRSAPKLRYVGADLHPRTGQARLDVTAIEEVDDCYDAALLSHVLGEVPDDRKAMRELHRVLKPGGNLIVQVPVDHGRESTQELRPRCQQHKGAQPVGANVRIYGRDFGTRLADAGFVVKLVRYLDDVSDEDAARYRLVELGDFATGNEIYIATKPGAAPRAVPGEPLARARGHADAP